MNEWLKRDEKGIWHPYTPVPFQGPKAVWERAEGAYVFDESGKKYFDATASWWCNIHGHCHPRLVRALCRQAKTLDQVMFAPHTHPCAVELAEKILVKAGGEFSKVFYSDDGSTAVEVAMKLTLQYWANQGISRTKFICMERAYHGDTMGTMMVSGVDDFHGNFKGCLSSAQKIPVPYHYRRPSVMTTESFEKECLEKTRTILKLHHQDAAALILEPLILGAGGMIVYSPHYLDEIMRMVRSHNLPVIFDEVFTGFGRTGTFFALDQVKMKPDLLCLSKGLTSGMLPMGATVVSENIFNKFTGGPQRAFYHGHTFSANALACAVALESLRMFEEEDVLVRNGPLMRLMIGQKERFLNTPWVGEVRQLGMVWVIELVSDKESQEVWKEPNRPGWKIAFRMWEKGHWIRPLRNLIYLVPPYCVKTTELEKFYDDLFDEVENSSNFQ